MQLNLPRDVLAGSADFEPFQTPEQYRPLHLPAGADAAIRTAAAMLSGARQPVIVTGGGIKNPGAHEPALALAEALGCPLVSAPGHGDGLPFGHPLVAGQMGPRGNPVASRLVREADVILALGTRLGFNSTFYSYDNINREAAIIQVELEPTAIGRFFPVKLGIWADAPTAAAQLTDAVKALGDRAAADSWVSDFQAERRTYLEERDAAADMGHPTQPSGLFQALAVQDAAITMDAGTLCMGRRRAQLCAPTAAGLRTGGLLPPPVGDQGSPAERPVVSHGRWQLRHDRLRARRSNTA